MKKCPQCGAKVGRGERVCGACGNPVSAPQKPVNASDPAMDAGYSGVGIYAHPGGSCLFAALLSVSLLPWLLNAGLVMLSKNLLPAILPLVTFLMGIVLGWIFLACAVLHAQAERLTLKGIFACCINLFVRGGGFALIVMFGFYWIHSLIARIYEQSDLIPPVAALILQFVLPVLSSVLIACFLLRVLERQKSPGGLIKTVGLILIARYAAPAIALFLLMLIPGILDSLSGTAVRMILTAMLQWCALMPLLAWLPQQKQRDALQISGSREKRLAIAAVGTLTVFCVLSAVMALPQNPKDAAIRQISSMTAEGDRFAAQGDLLTASACYRLAINRRDAWRAALSGDGYDWNACNDEAVRLLRADVQNLQNSYLYSWLLTQDCPNDYYAFYLDFIRESAKTEEDAAQRQRDILIDCVQSGIWTGSYTTRSALSDKQAEKLQAEIEALSAALDSRKSVMLYSDLAANGGVLTLDLAKRAVALAEEYPQDLALQGSAMELGCSYTDDLHENCYEGATAAAKRFDALFEQKNPDPTPHDYEAEKVMVAYNLMKIQQIEDAKSLLSDAVSKSDSVALRYLLATCHYRTGDYEVCAGMAEAIYAENPGHQQSLGLAMLARGLNGQLTESLSHALDLSKQAQSGNGVVGDSMLSTYARGMAGFYISRKQFPQRYDSLSDEDRARLEGDPLLYNMVLSSWQWGRKEYDDALSSSNEALKLCPEWPGLYYIQGCILFEQKNYQDAVEAFEQSVMISQNNPSAWFMLGQTLDRLELYELSVNAFQRVMELVPNSDHEVDKFGLALHAEWAVRDLQDYVGEGEKP
ncbi:tetratricopeptide repeat protein [Hungatella hathewayi]|uniref:tetratricopeptide repeat protein n=1 Tax=Hungatella hathewayi TaxID=154046 RepID=UPI0011DDCC51|nr:tetratricopeptide repeat protein [Hungatella hathewayi]